MNARTTDWTLATLVALLFGTGLLSLVSGSTGDRWVFILHGAGGAALGLVTGWKLRRVWRLIVDPGRWSRGSVAGLLSAVLVLAALSSGWIWANGGDLVFAGFNLLNWHITFGVLVSLMVLAHALVRAKPFRRRDLAGRRQAIHITGMTLIAGLAWWVQRPVAASVGWRGGQRRWTGSYEAGSFQGNAFPATSWVADRPRVLTSDTYRLRVDGLVATPLSLSLADLGTSTTMRATLDCTGGFFSTQDWTGVSLGDVLASASPLPSATHVRVVSYTGYRWSFPLHEAADLLLATKVAHTPLSHGHGAPVRLVAPGRRGFQWIKWVVRIEVLDGPDRGAPASTLWSSWTAEGRGEA